MRFYVLLVAVALLLAGCISSEAEAQGGSKYVEASYSIEDVKETHIPLVEKYSPSEVVEESIPLEEILSYESNESLPLRILFFNVGADSRLTLISKGDFDAAVVSVNDAEVDEAASLLQSYSDDIELFIIPFAGTASASKDVAKKLLVGKVVLPDYDSEKLALVSTAFTNVERVGNGDVIEEQGISFEFTTPFVGEILGDNNNAISFYLKDRSFSMFFSNDIIEGAMGRLTSEGLEDVDVMTIPNYGRRFSGGATSIATTMFDKLSPEAAILEGSSIDLENLDKLGDERAFPVLYFKTRGVVVHPVGNYDRLRLFYDGSSYNVTGVVE